MPMDVRWFGQAVREANVEHVAHAGLDRWAGDLPVEPPGACRLAGYELPIHFDGLEVHVDDATAGIGHRSLIGSRVVGDGIRRHGVGYRPVVVDMSVCVHGCGVLVVTIV